MVPLSRTCTGTFTCWAASRAAFTVSDIRPEMWTLTIADAPLLAASWNAQKNAATSGGAVFTGVPARRWPMISSRS